MNASSVPSTAFGGVESTPPSVLAALATAVASGSPGYFASDDGRMGFAEFDRASNRFARFLQARGIQPGDRVAALMHNSLDLLIAWFGTNKCGAVWVPTNTGYSGEWLRHQITDCDPALVIVEHELLAGYRKVELPFSVLVRGGDDNGFAAWQQADATPTGHEPAAADLAMLIYTSGTTGRAKGCMISHHYLCNYARVAYLNLPRRADEVLWTPLPLFHIAGASYVAQTLMLGGRSHFARGFSVRSFWNDIEAADASVVPMLGIATTLVATAPDTEASRRCFGKLRVLTGATSPQVRAEIERRFGVKQTLVAAFGQSEGTFITTLADAPYRPGTCGRPTDCFEVRVFDEHDREVPHGEVGEIVYRPLAANVMCSGYWRNPAATAAKSRNLWWHSGDMGRQDDDDYFYFVDRGDDRLRRSGENVSSFELETQFSSHEGVAVAAAFAVPSELADDEIMLAVIPREGSGLTAQALWEWAAERMPRFAVPRYIHLRTDLPRNPTGKVLKYILRADGVVPGTWDSKTKETK